MNQKELSYIRFSFLISTLICLIKFIAWWFTHSLVVLSDALESIINVAGAAFAWYSISLSNKPRDTDHPYGHGKIEFFSIGFEGAMILIAGVGILIQAGSFYFRPVQVHDLGVGLWLTIGTGFLNFLLGYFLVRKGKQSGSLTLQGNGKHILSDAYTSIGVITALLLILATGYTWIDPIASTVAAFIIIYTGYRLIRKAIRGLMDETDTSVVEELIEILKKNRKEDWIDIHNLRVQRFGNYYHIDCHITLPYYYKLEQVHELITEMDHLLNAEFEKGSIEFFIHTDPCLPISCSHCLLTQCTVRQKPFQQRIEWTRENLLPNQKHQFVV